MTLHPVDTSPHDSTERPRWKPAVTEMVMSLVALLSIGGLFFNYLNVYLTFFGESVTVTPDDVRWYRFFVGLLTASVIGSFAASIWRGGIKSKVWHALVALIGLVAAVVFSVSLEVPGQDAPPQAPSPQTPSPRAPSPQAPSPQAPSSGCHSGGDSQGCPGG